MSALDTLCDLVESMAARQAEPTWIDGMSLYRTTAVTDPLGTTATPTLALVLRGAKRAVLGRRVYDYRAGQFLIVTVDLPLVSQITGASPAEPFVALGIPLQPPVIASLLLEADSRDSRLRDECGPGPALAVSDADDDLLEAVTRLLGLQRRPFDRRVLAPGLIRELHWRLLTGAHGGLVRQIGLADSRLSLVSGAIRLIRQNFDQPLRSEDLAAQVGLSVATLNRHFRAVTSLSPLQYQKTLRLQQARLALLATPNEVARIGHEVGYGSLSQFSREYRRMFGAPPTIDAARLQTAVVTTA